MGTRLYSLPDRDVDGTKFDTRWVYVWRWGWIFFTGM